MRAIPTAFDVFVEGFELLSDFWVEVAEGDDVDVDSVFLEALGELFDLFWVFGDGRAGKEDDALVLRFVLAVLECELGVYQ